MSYILEALKKAQAERQIGSTPTIHAPTLASVPAGQGARTRRTPVIVAMVLMAAAIAGLATMLVRQQTAGNQAPSGTPAPAAPGAQVLAQAASSSASPTAVAHAEPMQSDAVQPASGPAAVANAQPATGPATGANSLPGTAPVGTLQPSAGPATAANAQPETAPARAAQPSAGHAAANAQLETAPARIAQPGIAPPGSGLPARAAPGTGTRAADAPPAEEYVQSLHELPEPIQRAIPQISLGGYMYSKNPADRLLLIDKVLRREGEEVAPGLVLDKLLPKQAVFSFRGYRYRVAL